MATESYELSSKLKDLLSQGRTQEHSIVDLLKKVELALAPYSPNVIRVTDRSAINPHLKATQIFAVAARMGGVVKSISNTMEMSTFGSKQLDIHMYRSQPPSDDRVRITDIQRFGKARLIGSPDANFLILTTENDQIIQGYSGLSSNELDSARAWLNDAGLVDPIETVVSQFQVSEMTTDLYARSIVFVPRPHIASD